MKLRELVLGLAVRGSLVAQSDDDEPVADLIVKLCRESENCTGDPKRETEIRKRLLLRGTDPWPVPPGWRFVQIEQTSLAGGVFCDGDWVETKDQDPIGTVRLTQLADVGDGVWRDRSNRFMNRETADRLRCTYLQEGDVLIARMPDPIGRAAIFPGDEKPCATVVDVAILRTRREFFDPRYVMMAINSPPVRAHIDTLSAGTTRQRVSRGNLSCVQIPLPPLAEQKRIVAKVDHLMALCDELEARQTKKREIGTRLTKSALEALTTAEGPEEFDTAWKRVVDNFDILVDRGDKLGGLRASILSMAVRGSATRCEPGDGAAFACHALLTAPSNQVEVGGASLDTNGPFRLREGWEWCSLGQLVHPDFPISYGVLVPGPEVPHGVPFVRIQDLSVTAPPARPAKNIAAKVASQYARTTLQGGEILLGVVGSIGKVGVAPQSWAGAAIARAVCRIMPHPGVDGRYLAWVLQSRLLQDFFLKSTRTLAQPTLNVGVIRTAPVPLPPLAEQKRIVAKLDSLMLLCDELEARLRRSEELAARLVEAVVQELVA